MQVDIYGDVKVSVVHSSDGDITGMTLEREHARPGLAGEFLPSRVSVYLSREERDRLVAALQGES